jgi:hypothetical protein
MCTESRAIQKKAMCQKWEMSCYYQQRDWDLETKLYIVDPFAPSCGFTSVNYRQDCQAIAVEIWENEEEKLLPNDAPS